MQQDSIHSSGITTITCNKTAWTLATKDVVQMKCEVKEVMEGVVKRLDALK
jgi:hypothetical protein